MLRLAGFVFIFVLSAFTSQLISPGTICIQIEPRPFGFRGELPIPNNKKGRTFLVELEEAWKESLRRRFLIRDDDLLGRIHWLEYIGVLTSDEAARERSLVEIEDGDEQQLIGQAALN